MEGCGHGARQIPTMAANPRIPGNASPCDAAFGGFAPIE
jgi:hypothetical protein